MIKVMTWKQPLKYLEHNNKDTNLILIYFNKFTISIMNKCILLVSNINRDLKTTLIINNLILPTLLTQLINIGLTKMVFNNKLINTKINNDQNNENDD